MLGEREVIQLIEDNEYPARVIEIGLFAAFAVHIATGTYLWVINRRARPRGYLAGYPSTNNAIVDT